MEINKEEYFKRYTEGEAFIIRKTKRSEKTKRSVRLVKRNVLFSRFPTTQNASDFSGAFAVYSSLHFRLPFLKGPLFAVFFILYIVTRL